MGFNQSQYGLFAFIEYGKKVCKNDRGNLFLGCKKRY